MPKIDLSFDEFLDVVGCMRSFIDEIDHYISIDEIDHIISDEARRLQHLYDELQSRYARATVEAELHPDAQIPDCVYAPDPEDFKEVP